MKRILLVCILSWTLSLSADLFEEVLSRYERPFTCLEMGSDAGAPSIEKAPFYPESVFIAFQGFKCARGPKNFISLNHRLTAKEIHALSLCEHVDVIFLRNPLEFFGGQAVEVISALQKMSHVLLLELPRGQDFSGCFDIKKEGLFSTFYLLEQMGPFTLEKTTLIHPRKLRRFYEIVCDYRLKYLKKSGVTWSSESLWLPGINLMTYLLFNGDFPSRGDVVMNLPEDPIHSDSLPNNMVIQGEKIVFIDKEDPSTRPPIQDGGHRLCLLRGRARKLIFSTAGLSPEQVRQAFSSIYHLGNYFDCEEVDE